MNKRRRYKAKARRRMRTRLVRLRGLQLYTVEDITGLWKRHIARQCDF